MIVGLLQNSQSRRAYVPGPHLSKARVRQMVADAQLEVVVTQKQVPGSLGLLDGRLVCLDVAGGH